MIVEELRKTILDQFEEGYTIRYLTGKVKELKAEGAVRLPDNQGARAFVMQTIYNKIMEEEHNGTETDC